MNNKFGPDNRYRAQRYPRSDDRGFGEQREPFWRGIEEDRASRSPDQEFETSANYREPYGEIETAAPRASGRSWGAEGRGGFAGRGPKGYLRADDRIRDDVCDRLSWNDEIDATEISVLVENGEVTLEGRVATRHMKRAAEHVTENVPGVTDVHNTLRVTTPILSDLKERVMGERGEQHYANTGTKTSAPDDASTPTGDGL